MKATLVFVLMWTYAAIASHVGRSNLRMVRKWLPIFAQEESQSILAHRKPVLEGETEQSLSDAIETLRIMEKKKELSPQGAEGLLHSLQDAMSLHDIVLQVGDEGALNVPMSG